MNIFKIRTFLIQLGKAMPFVVVFIVSIDYCESIIATMTCDYVAIGNNVVLNTPISFIIGKIFRYDWLLVFMLFVLSFAIRACVWNKLCVLYLTLQICERYYLCKVELYENQIISIATANLIVCGLLLYKSFTIIKH